MAEPLSLQSYQATASKSDRTRETKGQEFLLLGLFGEIGTLIDEVKKKQRDMLEYWAGLQLFERF